jgi:tetratricopeptide (TPR) repeat protein
MIDGLDSPVRAGCYPAAFAAYGIDVAALGPSEAAARIRDSAIREAMLAGLDSWMQGQTVQDTDRIQLQAVADAVDPSAWRRSFRAAALAKDVQKLKALAAQAEALAQPPSVLAWLGNVLLSVGLGNEAGTILRQAQARYPGDFWINYRLADLFDYYPQPHADEAVGYARAAVAIRPNSADARSVLAASLARKDDTDGAIAAFQQAIALDPRFGYTHFLLGRLYEGKGELDKAIAEYREAIRLDKDNPPPHLRLGGALAAKGLRDEAEKELRAACALYRQELAHDGLEEFWERRDEAHAYLSLGGLLQGTGRAREAEEAYRQAVASRERLAAKYGDTEELSACLGALADNLLQQGNHAEAAKVAQKMTGALPKDANAYRSAAVVLARCMALADKDAKLSEADRKAVTKVYAEQASDLIQEAARRGLAIPVARELLEALRGRLDDPQAHCKLGMALSKQERYADAEAEFREALRLRADYVEARAKLGYALWKQGKNAEAETECREVLRQRPGDPEAYFTLGLVLFWGGEKPVAAVRFYTEAFAAHPKLADDLRFMNRYNAACSAALAGCGQGKDAAGVDDSERARLRRQALDWLRADLIGWGQLLEKEPENARARVLQALRVWQQDADFNGVRGDALAKLPEAERQDWQQLWVDVEQTLRKVDQKDTQATK